MPITITKSVGTASRNYSTIQLFEDALPADLVAIDESWVAELYNDSEFTGAVTVSGSTTDATRNIRFTTAAGQSFRDHVDKLTNPLRYDQTKGVGHNVAAGYTQNFNIQTENVTVENIQLKHANASGFCDVFRIAATGAFVRNVLADQYDDSANAVIQVTAGVTKIINSVLIQRSTSKPAVAGLSTTEVLNSTLISPSDITNTAAGVAGTASLVKNCAIFGFNTATAGSASSGYNATDNASAPGINNQVSLTFANQFEGIATTGLDFRVKAGATLINNGTRDAANTNDLDIIGQSRSITTPTIGAWEYVTAGGAFKPHWALRRSKIIGAR